MINTLITSQTRIKLLMKFFLNSSTKAHLRGLESEFGESSNAIRVELNRFEEAGLLHSLRDGNKKIYHANRTHPLFWDIHNIIMKETGIDRVVEKVIHRIGNLICIYLTGDFAQGKDSQVIELILVGAEKWYRQKPLSGERSVILYLSLMKLKDIY
jgi:DNA-binding transcriptional ArsR family regulator